MTRLTVALACISLLCLQLPGTLARGRARPPVKDRKPPARTPPSDPQAQRPAARPTVWRLQKAHPQRSGRLAPSTVHPARGGPRRHHHHSPSVPHRPRAQLLRVGCVLGTCQVQNLSHRLWQLFGSAGPRDSVPVDPSSPHSYG
ncbi:protein ADM2 [Sorex araneus]|uniref:protein ADM2 n=1 Tax=Sorex araneus TaxID=42254 RepID=UPI00033175D2|nr:protein ADM2 [Sorex araneus]